MILYCLTCGSKLCVNCLSQHHLHELFEIEEFYEIMSNKISQITESYQRFMSRDSDTYLDQLKVESFKKLQELRDVINEIRKGVSNIKDNTIWNFSDQLSKIEENYSKDIEVDPMKLGTICEAMNSWKMIPSRLDSEIILNFKRNEFRSFEERGYADQLMSEMKRIDRAYSKLGEVNHFLEKITI